MPEPIPTILDKYIGLLERLMNPPKKPKPPKPAIRYGDFGTRVFASAIDMLLSLLIIGPFLEIFSGFVFAGHDINALEARLRTASTLGEWYAILASEGVLDNILSNYVLQSFILSVVVVIFWTRKAGTPGKLLLRLRIVDERTMQPPGLRQSIIRLLGYILSSLPLFLGFLAIAWNKKRQGWHDKLAGTIVVQGEWRWPWTKNEASSETLSAPPSAPPGPATGG